MFILLHNRILKAWKGKGGFTLLEILVVLSVFIVISVLIYLSYFMITRLSERENRRIELVQNGRVGLDRIVREMRQGEEIVNPLPLVSTDPDFPPPSEIIFQDGHVSDRIQYVRYYLDGTDLRRELSHYTFPIEDPDTWVYLDDVDELGESPDQTVDDDDLIAEHVTSLQFWGNARLITITLTTSQGDDQVQLLTRIFGRNLP